MIGWIFTLLAIVFIGSVFVLPNLGLDQKNSTASYQQYVFNEKKVARVDIQLEEEDWEDMMANPMEEEYKQATVTLNGKKVEGVAVRTKGNSSLSSVAGSDSERYSLKIDFDYYDSSQSLYGLKKLNLNNNYSDSTQMREFVSYELMEQMGLPTPSHSYMYVTVNGEDYGLFLGVEAVDETFLANNFGSTDGFLYKPDGTGSDLKWISDNIEDYTGIGLKTNEGNKEESEIINMLDAINNGGDLEKYLDVDEMLRYFAMNTALVSLDSYQGTMKHNYYLYEDNGIFSIIPWDYNMSFGGFGGMGGPRGEKKEESNNNQEEQSSGEKNAPNEQRNEKMPGMMTSALITDSNINFSISEPVSGTTLEDRPLLNALLSNETYKEKYEEYLNEIATKILTEENVASITKDLAAILTTYVEADPSKFFTTEDFLAGVSGDNSLPEFAKQRAESILKQLSGELVVESQASSGTSGFGEGMAPPNQNGNAGAQPNINNGELPEGFDPSKMPEGGNRPEMPEGFDPTQRPEGGAPPNMPEGSAQAQTAEGDAPANMPEGGKFGPGGQNGKPGSTDNGSTQVNPTFSIVISGVSIVFLLIVLIFVFKFKRRRGFRK